MPGAKPAAILTTLGLPRSSVIRDRRGERRDVDRGIGQRRERGADRSRLDQRQIALHIDDDIVLPRRIEQRQRLEDAVGARGMIGPRQHRLAARRFDRRGDLALGAGDDHRPERGLARAAPDMHDHRRAADVGERLAGQPRRGHARGNDEHRIGHLRRATAGHWSREQGWCGGCERDLSYKRGVMPHETGAEPRNRRANLAPHYISFELPGENWLFCRPTTVTRQSACARRFPEGSLMSFEANKIAGAILAAMILAMVSGIVANILVRPTPLAKQAYEVAGGAPAEARRPRKPRPRPGREPIAPLMASASVDAGKSKTQVCAACHTFDKGGPNRIGPNLYGVVGSTISREGRGGFAFSNALKRKASGKTWTLDNLNAWLFKPQEFAKGTKMTFVGLPKAEDRANVIAYLNSLSDHPIPVADLTKGADTGAPAAGGGGGQKAAAPKQGGAAPRAAAPGNQQGANPSPPATKPSSARARRLSLDCAA